MLAASLFALIHLSLSCYVRLPSSEFVMVFHYHSQSRYLSERKLEPKDVPGTFLNLALLNLGSQINCLRMAAYKLLCAVKETFKLDIEHYLDDSYGEGSQWQQPLHINY